MQSRAQILSRLEQEKDVHRRRLLLVGYLYEVLAPDNIRPILVGWKCS